VTNSGIDPADLLHAILHDPEELDGDDGWHGNVKGKHAQGSHSGSRRHTGNPHSHSDPHPQHPHHHGKQKHGRSTNPNATDAAVHQAAVGAHMVQGGSLYLTETFIMAMLKLATQGSTGEPHQANEVNMSRYGLLDSAAGVLARVIHLNADLVKVATN